MADHTLATHHVVDIAFAPELAARARANVARTGSPFPVAITRAASCFIRRPRHEQGRVIERWRDRKTVPAKPPALEPDTPVWCVDLEAREIAQLHALGMIHGFEELDDLIGFVSELAMQYGAPQTTGELDGELELALEERVGGEPLVLLDLDQTLLDYSKRFRAGVFDFIVELASMANVGIWSASSLGRVMRISEELHERTGVDITTRFGIEHTTSPLYYDCITGQLDRYQGTIAHRKELALLGWMGLDAARTILIDDASEHWSGQYNQIAVMPKPPLEDAGEDLDLEAVWSALLEHVELSFAQPDVRLAPRFYWRPEWFEETRRLPRVLTQRDVTRIQSWTRTR